MLVSLPNRRRHRNVYEKLARCLARHDITSTLTICFLLHWSIQVEYLGFTGCTGTCICRMTHQDEHLHGKLYDWLYTCTSVIERFIETGSCCTSENGKDHLFHAAAVVLYCWSNACRWGHFPCLAIVLKARVLARTSLVETSHHLSPPDESIWAHVSISCMLAIQGYATLSFQQEK